MKSAICSLMTVASLLVLATGAYSQEIRTDYDHHVNFSQYKTYSWAKVETPDTIWDERVKEAMDRVLAAKGWTQVPSGGNVSIVAVGTTHEKPTLRTFYTGFDGWRWGGFGEATTYVDNYEVGTLIVDMFDTSYQETDMAQLGERRPVQQAGEEHKEARQGSREDVRALSTRARVMDCGTRI